MLWLKSFCAKTALYSVQIITCHSVPYCVWLCLAAWLVTTGCKQLTRLPSPDMQRAVVASGEMHAPIECRLARAWHRRARSPSMQHHQLPYSSSHSAECVVAVHVADSNNACRRESTADNHLQPLKPLIGRRGPGRQLETNNECCMQWNAVV